ncbi:unnamed protein product [Notodromas monacha]|uniref:PAP-associated domain-containing protein n=2 Tax=Notodromas monacha TaxID=399045 RepID=A0A7R9GJX6_9CRUS|nr:unnamed protein product [Notodromas monacha]CAG0925320.1 unnamed protein product [Notodromas monacha]
MNLGELLTGFFEFGGQFDFKTKGMSLVTGKACAKPDHSPLYVENPLDRSLNVTRNVSGDEVDRFVRQCRESAWSVESNHASLPDLLLPAGSSMRFDLTSVSTTLPKFQVKNLFSLGKEPGSPPDRKQKKDTGFRRSSVGKRAFTKR